MQSITGTSEQPELGLVACEPWRKGRPTSSVDKPENQHQEVLIRLILSYQN